MTTPEYKSECRELGWQRTLHKDEGGEQWMT